MQVPNKMVGIEGDTRPVSGPNSPVNIEMTKKRRMNWDEVAGGNQNEANATGANNNNNPNQGLVKDHLQMERRKMGEWNVLYLVTTTTALSFLRESVQCDKRAGYVQGDKGMMYGWF